MDGGGYGILCEYMADAFGETTGTELVWPDWALAESFWGAEGADAAGGGAWEGVGEAWPSVVVFPAVLGMSAVTHLERRVGTIPAPVPPTSPSRCRADEGNSPSVPRGSVRG